MRIHRLWVIGSPKSPRYFAIYAVWCFPVESGGGGDCEACCGSVIGSCAAKGLTLAL